MIAHRWIIAFLLILTPAALAAAQEEAAEADHAAAESGKSTEPAEPVVRRVAKFTLRGSLPETELQGGLFAEIQTSLRTLVLRLNAIVDDDEVSGVWLDMRGASLGRAKVFELQQAIARLRAADKPVIAELRSPNAGEYQIAAACDEIVLPPQATLTIPGVRAEILFYKGLFDKLGVQADFLQMGEFKGAAEPYTRTEMSDAFRAEYEAVLDDYFHQFVQGTAADRGLSDEAVEKCIDQALLTPSEAVEAGLVDYIGYADRVEQRFRKRLEADELKIVRNYGREPIDTDFSGITGFFKLMELISGGGREKARGRGEKIALIYAVGAIVDEEESLGLFSTAAVTADQMVKAIHTATENDDVAAIVLRIDSPGGSALASDLIWKAVQDCPKPIVASMGDTAASGGYYIAMGADEIMAAPGTLTGSIGVVGGKFVLGGLYEKVGLKVDVIARGANSGIYSETSAFSASERERWQSMMEDVYDQFTAKAAEGRGLERDALEAVAQGRVWTGVQALEHKLVDRNGSMYDAIQRAKELAGLDPSKKLEILVLPEPVDFFEQLFGMPDDDVDAAIGRLLEVVPSQLRAAAAQAAVLRQVFHSGPAVVLPYHVEIR